MATRSRPVCPSAVLAGAAVLTPSRAMLLLGGRASDCPPAPPPRSSVGAAAAPRGAPHAAPGGCFSAARGRSCSSLEERPPGTLRAARPATRDLADGDADLGGGETMRCFGRCGLPSAEFGLALGLGHAALPPACCSSAWPPPSPAPRFEGVSLARTLPLAFSPILTPADPPDARDVGARSGGLQGDAGDGSSSSSLSKEGAGSGQAGAAAERLANAACRARLLAAELNMPQARQIQQLA